MARPKVHDEALRIRLLERAGQLLSDHGPEGLGLRRLASESGTSTTAVYSLFGGKPGLVRELYIEGFRRLGDRMERVPKTDNVLDDLQALGNAYRSSAQDNRNFYSIMFDRAVPDFQPDEEARAWARRSMRPLRHTVERGAAEGLFVGVAPEEIVVSAWGLVHGLVSLELSGSVPPDVDTDALYERALVNGMAGWLN
ncbi:TetR family transcriptional regulator [Allosaccharopolyspora coralli]|uniref:TetR family transcriptional regulator n=1 Tax=Allosaccharopolyspora coralli TaxID=2665642 RepID=A0A5Q3QAG2_9PSEU|nr:TetR-like C-terminal domain-containing protein [Allosaccharopolyspora coralli]QGK71373.1 TetR family transcriptional regulator [Allosaccharopolyspora coralli]